MGSSAIIIGAVAVIGALVGLLVGFLLGRKNVKSLVEGALEEARVALDAREFTLRRQMDEQMTEIIELRARHEELIRLQDPAERSKHEQRKDLERHHGASHSSQISPAHVPESVAPVESADQTIQKLLKSLEENLRHPEEIPVTPAPTDSNKIEAPQEIKIAAPISEPLPIKKQQPIPTPEPIKKQETIKKPEPLKKQEPIKQQEPIKKQEQTNKQAPVKPSPATAPPRAEQDEWQEFAASLEALTRRKL